MWLRGKDLKQRVKVKALMKHTGHGFAFQTSGKINEWMKQSVWWLCIGTRLYLNC